jgi:hypothetical protein
MALGGGLGFFAVLSGLSFPCVLCIPWLNFLTGGVTGRIKPQFVSTH